MKCPYCNHVSSLTWSRYFRSALGRHACPSCFKPFRIQSGLVLALLTLGVVWGVGIPCIILFHCWFGGYWALLGIIPAALVGVPLDRMLDNRYRKTQPIGMDRYHA
jgi:hypothetical protein